MPDTATELFHHHRWANERLIAACEALPDADLDAEPPGGYGSIRATLIHLFASETRYIAAMQHRPRPDELHEEKPFPGFPALRAVAERSARNLLELIQAVGPDDRMRGENRGEKYDLPLSVPLAQAINHATEHRTNITTAMAARGVAAPQLDVWQYARERGSG
jgi:uncharacterized damage-inducible protein DinB